MIELTEAARVTAGIVALSVVAIESGGAFLLRVVTGKEQATDFQKSFFRAGHAHAGVLVTLGLVCLVLGPEEALLEVGGLLLARDDAQQEGAAGLDRDHRERDDAGGDASGVGEFDHGGPPCLRTLL